MDFVVVGALYPPKNLAFLGVQHGRCSASPILFLQWCYPPFFDTVPVIPELMVSLSPAEVEKNRVKCTKMIVPQ